MDQLTDEEEKVAQEFLQIVNNLRHDYNVKSMSKTTALKFLMARKFDLNRSLALYKAHELARSREGLTDFDPNKEPLKSELESGKFTVLSKRDANGAAIVVFTAYKHIPQVTPHQVTLQGVVYQLDIALEDIQTQRNGIVFIYNMFNSKYANFDYELSQKILSLLKGAYPACLKKVLIVTAPLWFKAPFRIMSLFVREKLRDRVYMINIPQLPAHIPLSSLPTELGGQLQVDHASWINYCRSVRPKVLNEFYDLACFLKFPDCLTSRINTLTSHNSSSALSKSDSNEFNSPCGNMSDDEERWTNWAEKGGDKNSNDNNSDSHEINNKRDHRNLANKPKPENIVMPTNVSELVSHNEQDYNGKPSSLINISSENDYGIDTSANGMDLEEFIKYLNAKGQKGLFDEYNEIKKRVPDGTFDDARIKANTSKNRYTDVLCYDHSRVKLSIEDDDVNSDYINANFVDGYLQKNAFISTQGPLPKTYPDFWRMIWEQQSLLIVMTTRTIERARVKCGQYWPANEGQTVEFCGFQVTCDKIEDFQDHVITRLTLTNLTNGQSRQVTHMQFLSWPDYGVPHSAYAMLNFRDKVREEQAKGVQALGSSWTGHPNGPPIVVHCSAGIGRTGTFITLDISISQLKATGKINIVETVEKIRAQRAYSIQMPDQYVFCYLALLEYAMDRGLLQDVIISGFEDNDLEMDSQLS